MDKVFEKFGIYDFMGIWGPGALMVTYYGFTLKNLLRWFYNNFEMCDLHISKNQLLIIAYTAIAYLSGIILHEIGKIVADIFSFFDTQKAFEKISSCDLSKKSWIHPLKNIKYECKCAFTANEINVKVNFEKAVSLLKYHDKISTKRIDTYHSVYALARSLFLSFFFHIICSIVNFYIGNMKSTLWLLPIIIDVFLCILFFIRTYRYFHSWVKNVYIQYHYHFEERRKNDESYKTAKVNL